MRFLEIGADKNPVHFLDGLLRTFFGSYFVPSCHHMFEDEKPWSKVNGELRFLQLGEANHLLCGKVNTLRNGCGRGIWAPTAMTTIAMLGDSTAGSAPPILCEIYMKG
jgi:hypothetical protein